MPCLGSSDRDRECCGCVPACLGRRRRPQRPEAPSIRRAPREVANTSMIQMTAAGTPRSANDQQTPSMDIAAVQAVAEGQAVPSAANTRAPRGTHHSHNDMTRRQASHLEGSQSLSLGAEPQHITAGRSGHLQVAGRANLRVPSPAGPLPSGPAIEAAIHRVSPASAVAGRASTASSVMPRTGGREFEVRIDAALWIGLSSEQNNTASLDPFIDELAENYNRATPVQHPRMRRSLLPEREDPRNEWVIRMVDKPRPGEGTIDQSREPLPLQVTSKGT